jgi:hypothetical protein
MGTIKTITPKEFALQVNSDGRTVRKFLRSVTPIEDRPGKGNRWEVRNTAALRKGFAAWVEARSAEGDEGNDAPDA